MLETWVQSLGQEDPLEKEMATHSSILAWKISVDRGAWWATVPRVAESDMTEQLSSNKLATTEESAKTSIFTRSRVQTGTNL